MAGGAYAVQQVGRTAFMVIALRGHPLEANFQRIQSRAGFADAVALWWLYFDQSAEAAAEETARSDDPGRLGRSAYHLIHPVMVAGIIVAATADQKVLSEPTVTATTASAWMILGGPALFLAGHAVFKLVVWRTVSWPRIAGIAVLALLGLAAKAIPGLGLAACAAGVGGASAAPDRLAPHGLRATPQ